MLQANQGKAKIQALLGDVLVVDADPRTGEVFRHGVGEEAITIRCATDVNQAALEMKRRPADMVVVNMQINDNSGLELLRRLHRAFPHTEAVAMTRSDNGAICLEASQAGASDLLMGPMDPSVIRACILRAQQRLLVRAQLRHRNVRLRNVCKQLNKARHEISQQVNLLCHDLVKAYQELAEQLNQTQLAGDFATVLGEEVQIEALLRRTMEWLLQKLGPVNAAVFLPDSESNYTLGAYLNYDTNADSVLMDVIAQTVVPEASEGVATLVLENDAPIEAMFGEDGKMLLGRAWLACRANYQNECLGVVVVFRNQGEPVDPAWSAIIESVSPILAEKIAQSVRMYQRGMFNKDEGEEGESQDGEREEFEDDDL